MRRRAIGCVLAMGMLALAPGLGRAQVTELWGSWLIDGYRFDPGDRSPRGTIVYDRDANVFRGTYVGLKLPTERPELHAWVYDTRSKKSEHLGRIAYKAGTVGKNKATFDVTLPPAFKGGAFGA